MQTPYVNRRNTNDYVLKTAAELAGREIRLLSDLPNKGAALAGHVLTTNESDPLRQVTYVPNTANKYQIGKKRRKGGRRQNWRDSTHGRTHALKE